MNLLLYILRVLYRIRLWLLFIPLIVALVAILLTRNMERNYEVSSTVYTGVASGFNIESQGSVVDWNTINNAMDNLVSIIYSQSTLKRVSMRLYAEHMMYGDPDHDNNYIMAKHYRAILARTPKDVLALIDKTSEEKTLQNLYNYEKADKDNFVYGLFNWSHQHYSFTALKKIQVKRFSNSDMLEIKYAANDPGIAYHTLLILNEEFVNQYQLLRFGETDNVIAYFQAELDKTRKLLRNAEDSLTNYNIQKRIINYDEQTKHIASQNRDLELRFEEFLLNYESSAALLSELDKRIDAQTKQILNNGRFIAQLNNISNLAANIARIQPFQSDSTANNTNVKEMSLYKDELARAEDDFTAFYGPYIANKYTKEGIATDDIVTQWLEQLILNTKSRAELEVMRKRRQELDKQFVYFSPIGSTIKRKEREINITEQASMELLHSLNVAVMRRKNLQMSSATLKILNPPIYPLDAMPTARRLIVAVAFFGSIVAVLGYFLILEILDHTLRDKTRTERLTGGSVLGAFPGLGKLKYRGYVKECTRIAANYMSSAILSKFDPAKRTNVVNILSTEDGDGKNFLATQLAEYWTSLGMKVKVLSWEDELINDPKRYALATSIYDLYTNEGEDAIIINHPPMKHSSIPSTILEEASVNVLAARADRVWKDTDQVLYDRLKEQVGEAPMYLYLTQSQRETVENFTGLLPPYTGSRKLIYRLFQLGLTSSR